MMNVLLLFPRNPLVASTQPPATEKKGPTRCHHPTCPPSTCCKGRQSVKQVKTCRSLSVT